MVLTRSVLPGMLQRRRGHVVFLSSLAGTSGFAGMAVYSGTKAGLNNFVASIRMELKDTPITTTVVAPGPVDTEMWDRVEAATEYAALLRRLRLFRLLPKASPDVVARKSVDATVAGHASRADAASIARQSSAARGPDEDHRGPDHGRRPRPTGRRRG